MADRMAACRPHARFLYISNLLKVYTSPALKGVARGSSVYSHFREYDQQVNRIVSFLSVFVFQVHIMASMSRSWTLIALGLSSMAVAWHRSMRLATAGGASLGTAMARRARLLGSSWVQISHSTVPNAKMSEPVPHGVPVSCSGDAHRKEPALPLSQV